MEVPLFQRETWWFCPNCVEKSVTTEAKPHSRMHVCKGLRGLTAPMIQYGVKCKVEAVEREDYVAGAVVTTDSEGTPTMGVKTTREDGNDVIAFADCAMVRNEAN